MSAARRLSRLPTRSISWWVTGMLIGAAVVGPAWSGEGLLNLDLVVFDQMSVSSGVWGLGPEIPRQSPAIALIALASGVVDGTTLVALFMIGCIAGAFVGVARLSRPAPWHARVAAGLLYAASPWLVTRIAVGHLGLALAAALLPWVLPTLLRPDVNLRRTFLAAGAMGLAGYFGGSLSFLVVAVGVCAARGRGALRVALVWTVGQLPWMVPGLVVGLSSPNIAGGQYFPTALSSIGDLARLFLGYGFWQRGNQLGLDSAVIPFAAIVILALALFGAPRLPEGWGRRSAVLACIGLALASAGSMPLVGDAFDRLSQSLPGAALRESQRALVLFLVWLAPATARGIVRVQRRDPSAGVVASFGCTAIVVATISPALWGVGGRIGSVDLPDAWSVVRAKVEADPGTTLALPWNQYIDLEVADGRRTYHPIPSFIRCDVLNSSDPEFGPALSEAVDPREPFVDRALGSLEDGQPLSGSLAEIGVRWIVVLAGVDDDRYAPLGSDDGLRLAVSDDSIALYEVREWPGQAVDRDGEPVEVDVRIPPFVSLGGEAAVWFAPGSAGWLRGLEPTSTTRSGVIEVPAASGGLWYWPSLFVLAGYIATAGAAFVALRTELRRPADASGEPSPPRDPHGEVLADAEVAAYDPPTGPNG